MDSFEAYGEMAARLSSPLAATARYGFQGRAMGRAVADVVAKLRPRRDHRLLEVGCNVGLLLSPLAEHVAEAVGIDHPRVLERYRERGVPGNVSLVPGRWPEARPGGDFDLILAYAVIHYLPTLTAARGFIDACLGALRPGGRLLVGDLPNRDARGRFLASEAGRAFAAGWEERKSAAAPEDAEFTAIFAAVEPPPIGAVGDAFVLRVLASARREGHEGYVLPQPGDLPFGHTREDILICKRP